MKKNGFTLAEVLITLTIIGVIATMTLPALMTNTAEQQAKTGIRKGVNTLTEAAQMSNAIDGFDYGGLKTNTYGDDEAQSFYAILAKRAAVDFGRSTSKAATSDAPLGADNAMIFFRDGSSVEFTPDNTITTTAKSINTVDNLPVGFTVIYDYNGAKTPNTLSNCLGATSGPETKGDQSALSACTKATRVIKDKFTLQLRGNYVEARGGAARWALEN